MPKNETIIEKGDGTGATGRNACYFGKLSFAIGED